MQAPRYQVLLTNNIHDGKSLINFIILIFIYLVSICFLNFNLKNDKRQWEKNPLILVRDEIPVSKSFRILKHHW